MALCLIALVHPKMGPLGETMRSRCVSARWGIEQRLHGFQPFADVSSELPMAHFECRRAADRTALYLLIIFFSI
jgi:hypothetical protein